MDINSRTTLFNSACRLLKPAVTLFFALSCCFAFAETAKTVQLKAGRHRITAEIAATPGARDRGLMNRKSLAADGGMLFVFPEAHRHCMWMSNTLIPLSVAFIDDDRTIVNIADMKPRTEDYHCASRPVRFALEMNSGWFGKRGILPRSRVAGLEKAPKGR